MLRIGVSACFFHPDPKRPLFKGKRLLYMEQELGLWCLAHKAIPFLIPETPKPSKLAVKDLVRELDGLLLQGGSDVAPESYGETPLHADWKGDKHRDNYEIALVNEFRRQKKPILGICRGAQLLNVAMGGSLYQDIPTQTKTKINHRNWDIYEENHHKVQFSEGSLLTKLLKKREATVNSIHHQAIKKLGKDLIVEATCIDVGLVEAVRHKGKLFIYALQWHPEFHFVNQERFLNCSPLFEYFLKEVRKAKKNA